MRAKFRQLEYETQWIWYTKSVVSIKHRVSSHHSGHFILIRFDQENWKLVLTFCRATSCRRSFQLRKWDHSRISYPSRGKGLPVELRCCKGQNIQLLKQNNVTQTIMCTHMQYRAARFQYGRWSAFSATCWTWSMKMKQHGASIDNTTKPASISRMPPTRQPTSPNRIPMQLYRPNRIATVRNKT